jgi:CubicO group peptidase (beta-lactamase class C family)
MHRTGFSKSGLQKLHTGLSGYVERGEIPGLVALVSRHDDLHIETLGSLSINESFPITRDAIFRIASITKPITAAAAMILVEQCKLRLDHPIDRWLPELANRRVLKSLASPLDDTVPATRAITLRDLLTSCMGFGSIMAPPDTYPIQKRIREFRIGGDGPMLPAMPPAMDEWLKRLGSLPWITQPGERWLYHVSSDVLGALIARVSGKSLGAFLRDEIFDPLGMKDTSFTVSAEQAQRLTELYFFNDTANQLQPFDSRVGSGWLRQPKMELGGGGLVSTIDDYFAFSRMLLNKGHHGKERILSRASVELMTSDQLAAEQRTGADIFFGSHSSWGFGGAVCIRRTDLFQTPGRYGWDGGFGTSAYIDPTEGMIGILFTQRMMTSPEPPGIYNDFWTLAYTAME